MGKRNDIHCASEMWFCFTGMVNEESNCLICCLDGSYNVPEKYAILAYYIDVLFTPSIVFITVMSQWARWRLKSPASRFVNSIVYSDADQRKHQSSASLAFVRGIHRGPVNSPYKWPVTRKMFLFDDVIITNDIRSIALNRKIYLLIGFPLNFITCRIELIISAEYKARREGINNFQYTALPICRGHFSLNNSRKTLIARP